MCQCCQSFFCGIANALDNLFACPNARNNNGCGCNGGDNGCGCGCNNNGYGVANAVNAVNNLFQSGCGCNNGCGNNVCGCGYDVYYARQYALGPFSAGCNVCGF